MGKSKTALDIFTKRRVNHAHAVAAQQAGSKELLVEYGKYKSYSIKRIEADWPEISGEFYDKNEAFYYRCIVDFCIDKSFLSIGVDEEKLAEIFKHDVEFKAYCKLQVGNRRSFGSFSANKKILDTSKIEAALKLV